MRCTKCGQRDATTYVNINNGGVIKKMYLCDLCAEEYSGGFGSSFGMLDKLFDNFPIGMLPGMDKLFQAPAARTMRCPECGTTSEEFLNSGFVGCANCYKAFEPLIVQTVRKLQQSDNHVGKTPAGAMSGSMEERLRAELRAALENNDYDRVGELNEKLKKLYPNGGGDKQ